MDLNDLLSSHQVSLMRASGAESREARTTHCVEAAGLARRVAELQSTVGATMTALKGCCA